MGNREVFNGNEIGVRRKEDESKAVSEAVTADV